MTVLKANKDYFKNALYSNIKFSIVIEFIVGLRTFHLIVEIIMLIMAVFIAGVLAVTESNPRHKIVNLVFTRLSQTIGIILFVMAIYPFLIDLKLFFTKEMFVEFSIPIVLGIWVIPLLYTMHIFIIYENVYASISNSIKDKKLYRFIIRQGIWNFGLKTQSLIRWRQSLFNTKFHNKQDVLLSFLDQKRLEIIEIDPPEIHPSKGWSPYLAKNFLQNNGIPTNHYKRCFDNEWQSISDYVKLGEEITDNNIAYYVVGEQSVAKSLKLVLNVNLIKKEDIATEKFILCTISLTEAALQEPMPKDMLKAILSQKNYSIKIQNRVLKISKINHLNSVQSYTLKYTIEQLHSG